MFNPWTASFEEAKAFDEAWIEDGKSPRELQNRPFFQWADAQRVEKLKPEIDEGSGFAVLAAVRICLARGLVAPEWLASAYIRHYDTVLNCRADSWDDEKAFGRPYRKGAHLHRLRKHREKRLAVWLAVQRIQAQSDPRPALDKEFFDKIGKDLGLGATLAQSLYYEAEKFFNCKPGKNKNSPGIIR